MSDYIPFKIQSEIIKRLPVKSIVQFRSVSKEWKSFIDNPEFIKTYHINHPNPHHHLLVRYDIDYVPTYTSIIQDDSFLQQKFSLTSPELFNLLRYTFILGSAHGLLCFYGFSKDTQVEYHMVVIWNLSVRKCVGIHVPSASYTLEGYTRIAFGVCPETNDPKLVKIDKLVRNSWKVQVFTSSSRVWKTVYTGAPFTSCDITWNHVSIDGIIYWSNSHSSFIISFDLKSEKFGEVSIPEKFVRANGLWAVKVNDSLGLLECYKEVDMSLCGVWMRKDAVSKPFTKIYTVKVEGKSMLYNVIGFRNNGEVVLRLDDDDDSGGSQVEVYELSSGRINSVGISGGHLAFYACSYTETLLLLDQENSIIY